MKTVYEPARETPVGYEADVIVAGAGLSGTAAAIAAARAGARTVLFERQNCPGGTITSGLITGLNNLFFAADGTLVMRGIAAEIIERHEREKEGKDWRWEHDRVGFATWLCTDAEKMKLLLTEMLEEAGVEMIFGTSVAGTVVEDQAIKGVIVENKSGRVAALGKVVVDSTGDADVAARAGAPVDYLESTPEHPGGHARGETRGGRRSTFVFRLGNVDLERAYSYLRRNPDELFEGDEGEVSAKLAQFDRSFNELGFFYLFDRPQSTLRRAVLAAIANGDFARERLGCLNLDRLGMEGIRSNNTVTINTGVFMLDDLDARQITQAETVGRKVAFYVTEFLRKYVPGFEQATVIATAAELGRRITRKIKSSYLYRTPTDLDGVEFDDVVGMFTMGVWIKPYGRVSEIPYRCLLPLEVENLIVASGKSFPIDTWPSHPVRESTVCIVQGQAGGVAAAVAAAEGVTPRALSHRDVQRALLRQGVYLGSDERLARMGLQ